MSAGLASLSLCCVHIGRSANAIKDLDVHSSVLGKPYVVVQGHVICEEMYGDQPLPCKSTARSLGHIVT